MSYGYNVNPMNQRRREPIAAQGEITGKAFVDPVELADRREAAADAYLRQKSYPGAENDDNLMVMPGELVFGLRKRQSHFMASGEPNEFGLSAMAGLNYGRFISLDHMMRDYYFIGIAKTEFKVGNSDQPESGFATLRAGSYSSINNGPHDIFAGDLVGYRFPLFPGQPGYSAEGGRSQKLVPYNMGAMDQVVPQNRGGTPNTKYLAELVPFDYTDFTTSLAGSLAGMKHTMGEGGCSDQKLEAFWEGGVLNNRPLTNGAEEQMGYKYGLVGVVLRGIESLLANGVVLPAAVSTGGNSTKNLADEMVKLSNTIQIFEPAFNATQKWYLMLSDIFAENQIQENNNQKLTDWINVHKDASHKNYVQLTRHCMKTLCSGIASSWYHMSTRVVGRAMCRSRPTETAHIVFGHWRRL